MIKKNKKLLLLTSIVILLPVLAGLMMWNVLPDSIATHWGANGEVDGWSSKAFAVFGLPFIMLAIHWICVISTAQDPKNQGQNSKVFGMVLWIFPVVSILMNSAVYMYALGIAFQMDILVRILIGMLFFILGNYLPKCTQNHTIGIKVVWALRNKENWNKTHRFAGRLWVLGGVMILASMLIPTKEYIYIILVVTIVLAFAPMIYSYCIYRKQRKQGTVTKEEMFPTKEEKKWNKISCIIGIFAVVFVMLLLFTGDFEVQQGNTSFTVNASLWEDATINYADVEAVEYRQQDDPGMRTFGYGSLTLMMGDFENDEFGKYTRYSYTKCKHCVVLTVKGKTVVLNGKNEIDTQKLYDELVKRVN